jgi:hypothetical protein
MNESWDSLTPRELKDAKIISVGQTVFIELLRDGKNIAKQIKLNTAE